jgi:hypothetical protein
VKPFTGIVPAAMAAVAIDEFAVASNGALTAIGSVPIPGGAGGEGIAAAGPAGPAGPAGAAGQQPNRRCAGS